MKAYPFSISRKNKTCDSWLARIRLKLRMIVVPAVGCITFEYDRFIFISLPVSNSAKRRSTLWFVFANNIKRFLH